MSRRIEESEGVRQVRVLVTGASGFVGSAIAEHCHRTGMKVLSTGRSGVKTPSVPNYFKADVTEPGSLLEAMSEVDCVVHAAGLAHQFRERLKPAAFIKINVKGSENVAAEAVRSGVKHLVLISSVSVYGPHGATSCDENTPCQPIEPYAQSKHQAENRMTGIIKDSETCLTILRLATVYGERDPGNVARLMRTIDRGRFVWVGDGSNQKSLIHRDDVARACAHVVRQAPPGINIYNVSATINTMREIVEGLASALGRELPRWRIPAGIAKTMAISFDRVARGRKPGGRFASTVEKWLDNDVYDGSKFNRQFGFASKVSLPEGLHREVAWYRQSDKR